MIILRKYRIVVQQKTEGVDRKRNLENSSLIYNNINI